MAGHVNKLQSGKWQARFPTAKSGRFRSKNFDRKTDAERWLREQNDARDRGHVIDTAKGKEPFEVVAEEWYGLRGHLAKSTLARDRSYLDSIVLPEFGNLAVSAITTLDIERWVAASDKSPATTRKAYQILSGIMARAVKTRRIPANPAKGAEGLPRVEHEEMRFLTRDEVDRLALAAFDHESLIYAAAYTGMRWAELVGLKHDQINRSARTISVSETLVEVNGHLITKSPKTASSKRSLSVPASLLGMIPEGEGYVFTAPDGGPIRRSNFRNRVWEPAIEETGLRGVRFHDLRHTHASWLIEQGVHPKVISSRLGHSSIRITLDRYGHIMPGLDEQVADVLEEISRPRLRIVS